jgi:hypothetical protein
MSAGFGQERLDRTLEGQIDSAKAVVENVCLGVYTLGVLEVDLGLLVHEHLGVISTLAWANLHE